MSPQRGGFESHPRTKDRPFTQRIFDVLWDMKKNGYSENTIEPVGNRLKNLSKHVNLDIPDEDKEFIARADWSNGYKDNLVNAHNHYAVFRGLSWRKPTYQRAYNIKKLPLESDINLIISYTKTRNRVAFRLIKEFGLSLEPEKDCVNKAFRKLTQTTTTTTRFLRRSVFGLYQKSIEQPTIFHNRELICESVLALWQDLRSFCEDELFD